MDISRLLWNDGLGNGQAELRTMTNEKRKEEDSDIKCTTLIQSDSTCLHKWSDDGAAQTKMLIN